MILKKEVKINLKVAIFAKTEKHAEYMLKLINSYDRTENNIFQAKIYKNRTLTIDGTEYIALVFDEKNIRGCKADQVIYDPFIIEDIEAETAEEYKKKLKNIKGRMDDIVMYSRLPEEFEKLKIQHWNF